MEVGMISDLASRFGIEALGTCCHIPPPSLVIADWPLYIPGAGNNRDNPSEICLKRKSHKTSFTYNLFLSQWILLKFCIEHGSYTAVLYAKFQKDMSTKVDVIRKWDFSKFQYKIGFGWIVKPQVYKMANTGHLYPEYIKLTDAQGSSAWKTLRTKTVNQEWRAYFW